MSGGEPIGCVSYPVRIWTDVLLGSTAVVYSAIVGPVVAPGGLAVVPLVLARIIIRCLDRIVDEIVVID